VKEMRPQVNALVVGHLPIHFQSLAKALGLHYDVSILRWRSLKSSNIWASSLVVLWLTLRVLISIYVHHVYFVIAQNAFPDGFSVVIASLVSHRPSFVQVVGSDITMLRSRLKRWLTSWTLSHAVGVICVSRDLELRSKRLGAKQTFVIPNPIDLSSFHQTVDIQRKLHSVVSVANLIPTKGIRTLLEASSRIPEVELYIVGEGPERANLEELCEHLGIQNRTRFTGLISQQEVARHLLSSAIFVLPSLTEGVPRSMLEAMWCGTFVIATNVGGIPDIIADGVNGLLVKPNDVEALTRAIRRALEDPDLVERSTRRNRILVQRFEIRSAGKEIATFIRETIRLSN